jgi:hypothetical protein
VIIRLLSSCKVQDTHIDGSGCSMTNVAATTEQSWDVICKLCLHCTLLSRPRSSHPVDKTWVLHHANFNRYNMPWTYWESDTSRCSTDKNKVVVEKSAVPVRTAEATERGSSPPRTTAWRSRCCRTRSSSRREPPWTTFSAPRSGTCTHTGSPRTASSPRAASARRSCPSSRRTRSWRGGCRR